ncbi:MAG: efflux RND transporter periplasmic adaptor subunit [Candidatus Aminicenantales bacterium]
MKRKIIIIIIAVVIIGLIVLLNYNSRREKSVKVSIEKVKKTDLTSIISASGEIKPKKSINISALIMGRIEKIGVKEGDVVKTGDFLLKLDATQYEANAERDRAFIQSSQAELIKAQMTLEKNKSFYDRQKNLYDNGLISKEQLEQAKVQLDISDAGARSINFQIQQAQASLKSTMDILGKTAFTSPIDGIITSRRAEEGEMAIIGTMNNPGTVLMTIADLSVMEVEVQVDETDVVGVELGQTANIRVDAFPNQVIKGKVTEIGSSALPKVGATTTTQESKDFKVVVTLENPSKLLKPGLSASADIITAEKKQVLAVPISALVIREKKADAATAAPSTSKGAGEEEGIYIVENSRVKFVPVKKGITGELTIEISSGLNEGQDIVVGPYDALRQLKDGVLIKTEAKKQEEKK